MKYASNILTALITFGFLFPVPAFSAEKTSFNPPPTIQKEVKETLHGTDMTDYYRWLEDKKDPAVIDWTRKQHDYTINYINQTTADIPGVKKEMEAFIDRNIKYPPFFRAKREFFYIHKKGCSQYQIYTRLRGKEILLFDPVKYDPSGKTSIMDFNLNKDASKVAIVMQNKGTELGDCIIIDTKTGKQTGDKIKSINSFDWRKDERFCFITPLTKEMVEKQQAQKTYLHKIRDNRKNDILITSPANPKMQASVYDTRDADVTVFDDGDFYSNTIRIRPAKSNSKPVEIYSSTKFNAYPYFKKNKIYILTNYNAPNKKLMIADLAHPEFKYWKDFYPQKDTVLESYVITSDYVLIQDKKDIMSRIMVYDMKGKFIKQLKLPEFGNVSRMDYHKESNSVYVDISTFTSPGKVYKLDGRKLTWKLFYQDKSPVDLSDVEAKLVFYPSKDKTKIPMFIVHKKNIKLDGTNPTLLYGYGGFNSGITPYYAGYLASFIKRGGVYANAGIRGGDEYGEKWHEDGMLKKKQNTFDDFIAGAEYLIKQKYTNPQKLAIQGGSNGGLLIGAVITQRPELFKAALCEVPLLDMIRFHKFLIAPYWIPEYGDPDKKDDFDYIIKYSPYHNIKPGMNLPTTLVIAGENDSRVDPLHAKKFVAKVQNNQGQINPVLLYIEYDSGHGSGKGIQKYIEDNAVRWRFIMGQLGMKD